MLSYLQRHKCFTPIYFILQERHASIKPTDCFCSMLADLKWTVFVPYKYLVEPSAYLSGTVSHESRCVNVSHLVHSTNLKNHAVIGVWQHDNSQACKTASAKHTSPIWVRLIKDKNGHLQCSVEFNKNKLSCHCVVFDPDEVSCSYFLPDENVPDGSVISYIHRETAGAHNQSSAWRNTVLNVLWVFQLAGFLIDNRL